MIASPAQQLVRAIKGAVIQIRRRVAFLATLLVGLTLASSASAATITVTTTEDDVTPNDGSVSLREAITAINAGNNLGDPDIVNTGAAYGTSDTIHFNIAGSGPHTIVVGSTSSIGLPTLAKPVVIDGTSQPGSSPNTLANGDNASTLIRLDGSNAGPVASGLFLAAGSSGSTIRGLDVFGFAGAEITIQSSILDTVAGNEIGFDLGGGPSLSPRGVLIQDAAINLIGGTPVAARNVISGNFVDGVEILGSTAEGNVVEGNFIGTGLTGVSALANGASAPAGAGGAVQIIAANSNTIGGTVAGARNVISGNAVAGVLDNRAQSNVIEGNFVGVGADGVTAVPNAAGVWLMSSNVGLPAQNNLVGGTVAGSGNLIAFNTGTGVIVNGAANGNGIFGNAIYANGLGIDLGNDGVTPNSPGGPHSGPNKLQNFPLITAVNPGLSATTVQGTLNATPSTAFRLEFFSSAACDPSGFGQGRTFLGFTNVTTDGSGNASFSPLLSVVVGAGTSVTATATDPTNDTSEFSRCFPPLTTTPTITPTITPGLTPSPPLTVTPRVSLGVAKVQKDGSITLYGIATVAGKVSALGTLGSKGSAAAAKRSRKRHKTPAGAFGPASKTIAAGGFILKLKPNSTALVQLRSGKRLTVVVTLTLSPAGGGKPLSTTVRVSDRLPRRHGARH